MSCGLQAARTHAHTHTYLLCPHRIDIPSSQVLTLRLTENAKPGRVKGKGKIRPRTGHEGSKGAYRYSSTVFLTSTLDGGGWSTPEKDLVPIVQEVGRAPEPTLMGAENLVPHRDSILGPSIP